MALLTDDERDKHIIEMQKDIKHILKFQEEHKKAHSNYLYMIWAAIVGAIIGIIK